MFIALVISVLILPVALSANNDSLAVAIQEYFEHKAGDYFLNGYTSIDLSHFKWYIDLVFVL